MTQGTAVKTDGLQFRQVVGIMLLLMGVSAIIFLPSSLTGSVTLGFILVFWLMIMLCVLTDISMILRKRSWLLGLSPPICSILMILTQMLPSRDLTLTGLEVALTAFIVFAWPFTCTLDLFYANTKK